jgi:hypothetical protein
MSGSFGTHDRVRARARVTDPGGTAVTLIDGTSGDLFGSGNFAVILGKYSLGTFASFDRWASAPDGTTVDLDFAQLVPPYTSASFTENVTGEFVWVGSGRYWDMLVAGSGSSGPLTDILNAVQHTFPATS